MHTKSEGEDEGTVIIDSEVKNMASINKTDAPSLTKLEEAPKEDEEPTEQKTPTAILKAREAPMVKTFEEADQVNTLLSSTTKNKHNDSKSSLHKTSRSKSKKEKVLDSSNIAPSLIASSKPDNLLKSKKRRHDHKDSSRVSTDAIKTIENKIEELRKASMNEINRLEAKMENDSNEKSGRLTNFEDHFNNSLNDIVHSNQEK